MSAIRIRWPKGELTAELADTPTARKLLAALPCKSTANTWGEEVYFEVPVKAALEPDAQEVVDPGTVCFWVEGSSLALPFGPTPASKGDECRLVTRVNILGKIQGDPSVLRSVKDGDLIAVSKQSSHADHVKKNAGILGTGSKVTRRLLEERARDRQREDSAS